MEEKRNRLNEIFEVLEKAIPNENSQIFEELVSIVQELTLKIEYDEIQIFRQKRIIDLYKYLTDESLVVAEKLYDILGDSVKKISRRPNQIGSVGGDTTKCWAYDIYFIDWEIQNHKNEKGSTLDNCDYWLPIIRQKLNVSETYWHGSNYATIWIEKEGGNF